MENKITPQQYDDAWQAFQRGEMSLDAWTEIATKMWEQTRLENVDVLKRLASR
jgi:hypothetical protein